MSTLLEVLALVIGQVLSALPEVLWNLREKSHEAVEAVTDHDLAREFELGEWMS